MRMLINTLVPPITLSDKPYKQAQVSCSHTQANTHTYAVFCRGNQSVFSEKKQNKDKEKNRDRSEQKRLCFQTYGRLLMQYSLLLPVDSPSPDFLNRAASESLNETHIFTSGSGSDK